MGSALPGFRLARTPKIGPLTFHRRIARTGSAEAALEALPHLSRGEPFAPPPVDSIERELAALDQIGARMLASCETLYPAALSKLDAPPPMLTAHGDLDWLSKPAIALVGAKLAADLARDLGQAGYVIVSGMARGIDASAHRAALDTGTIAVLAGGLDKPYPPQNEALHADIVRKGCVVSEAPLGVVARARDFPRRNAIVSGLARAVVVVEAAERSGSLITARTAGEQGRDVMAAPGSPLDPRCRGSNRLIKQGAALIESADDVLAALEAAPRALRQIARPRLFEDDSLAPAQRGQTENGITAKLAALLSPTPVHLNELARQLEAPLPAVAASLTDLEFEGRAETLSGGYAVRATPRD